MHSVHFDKTNFVNNLKLDSIFRFLQIFDIYIVPSDSYNNITIHTYIYIYICNKIISYCIILEYYIL